MADADVADLLHALHSCEGTVHVSGVGKSGIVGNRMAISLTSVGIPAAYVHGTEWVHGDLGTLRAGDCVVGLSHSGESQEMLDVMTVCRKQERGVTLIAIVGRPDSS